MDKNVDIKKRTMMGFGSSPHPSGSSSSIFLILVIVVGLAAAGGFCLMRQEQSVDSVK